MPHDYLCFCSKDLNFFAKHALSFNTDHSRLYMPLIKFKYFIVFLFLWGCIEDQPTNDWETFVTFKKGNFPLLIVAPHGGDLKPQWIQNRECEGAVTVQDQYTLGIAFQIENELRKRGYNPYMLLANIHRIKIDLNRPLVTSFCIDNTPEGLWNLFHNQIETYRSEVINQFGRGLLIDLHGHGHTNQRIELGYLLSGEQLRNIKENEFRSSDGSSIQSMIANHPDKLSLLELLRGQHSLGTLLSMAGYPSVPSIDDPAPSKGDPFFSGGTITQRYGSKNRAGVDAIQIELNRQNVRETSSDREQFSREFAQILIDYMHLHYYDILEKR